MAMENNPEKKPLGERIRDFITPALEDERKAQIELDLLNSAFDQMAKRIPAMLENSFQETFNQASRKRPDERNPFIISQLTQINPMTGEALFSPSKRFQIAISVNYTNFAAADIKKLPGYIRLHEMARDENIAIRVMGLTADEAKNPSGVSMPPLLVVDASKEYIDGAKENSKLYPDLPERKVEFNRKKPQDFTFDQ